MTAKDQAGDWAHRTRIAASWMSGSRAKKLNELADEMDEVAGTSSRVVENPDQRAQGPTAEKRASAKRATAKKAAKKTAKKTTAKKTTPAKQKDEPPAE